jgi:hypothetical protein
MRAPSGIAIALAATLTALTGCDQPPPLPPQPVQAGVPYGSFCAAGSYSCPASGQVGAPCACPGLGAPSYGTIR